MIASQVIEVRNLRKVYHEGFIFGKKLEALRGVSLDIHSGEVFGLLGPNGAGKTTLIKILLGILHPTQGNATVLGLPAGSQAARQRIGYLPENMAFPRHHTGLDALWFYGRLSRVPSADIRKKAPYLIELVGLAGREKEPVRKYSKGMRQRLGLAQAMLHDPEILIMDEPTDGLDPLGRSQIRAVIEQLKDQGKTIFLNSHILQEVELICDRVAIMAHGLIRDIGTLSDLTSRFQEAVHSQVTLELVGTASQISESLASYKIVSQHPLQHGPGNPVAGIVESSAHPPDAIRTAVVVEVGSPQQLDALIDTLRAHHVSIVLLHRKQPRLEDVFMTVVTNANNSQAQAVAQ